MKSFFQNQQNVKEFKTNENIERKISNNSSVMNEKTELRETIEKSKTTIDNSNSDKPLFKIIDFPFQELIISIWEKNGRKVHKEKTVKQQVEKIPVKVESIIKPDIPYSPYENFF